MSFDRYLLITSRTLRNDVLPHLTDAGAREQVINCIRVLSRLAIGLQADKSVASALKDDVLIPTEIREAFDAGQGGSEALLVAEDITVDAGTLDGVRKAVDWIASIDWRDANVKPVVDRLLCWEESQRKQRLQQLAEAEAEPEASPESGAVSGGRLNERVLLEYLRQELGNPELQIESYKPLRGGRTRKTVVFQQTGQGDWPEWLVVQCDPPAGYHPFPGVASQYPVLDYAYESSALRVPQPLLLELNPEPFGTPFMIVAKMEGEPPSEGIHFFAPPPPSEALALDIARQLAILHSLSVEPVREKVPDMLPGEGGWPGDLTDLMTKIESGFQGPSIAISAAFAWMKRHSAEVQNTVSLVHGDFLQHNMLVNGDAVAGILDWEGVRIGHPGEDLGYVRPMIEQMTSWDKFMAVYREAGGPAFSAIEADYFTLRAYILLLTMIARSKNGFENGLVDDIRTAEVGCSLGPHFIDCVAKTVADIFHRQ